jgi:phosphoesterase RecJ-like protein
MISYTKILQQIIAAIKKNTTFFIAGHQKPDGDTVGSAVALQSLLQRLGKKAYIYTSEPLPGYLTFLPGSKKIHPQKKVARRFDCAIILECVNFERMGDIIAPEQADFVINIDHHAHFNYFGNINFVNPKASSSAEQIFYLFKALKMPLTKYEADALYVGLVTDTGKFQQANTTPAALTMAAALLEAGVVPTKMFDKLYATQSLSSLKLLGCALESLKLSAAGKIASLTITRSVYARTGSDVSETEGIINYAMMIPGVCVGILFRETETPGVVKASFRSRGIVDVNKVSNHFGGGGHKNAAGCSIRGTIASAEKQVLAVVEDMLPNR